MEWVSIKKNKAAITRVVGVLKVAGVVAVPTETAYGLLAKALNPKAVAAIVKLKGRTPGKPMALVAASLAQVRKYFYLSRAELKLARNFWPGPLTLLLRPRRKFPQAVTGKDGKVGVRVPGNGWLRQLIAAVGCPLTATSANRAGGPTSFSLTTVRRELASRGLKYAVDGGKLPQRMTSTVVVVRPGKLTVVRAGAVPARRLKQALSV